MNKITVKEFVEGYNKCVDSLKKKYTDENGEIKFRKTDNIHVNSFVQYMLFVREVIEKYTNLICSDDTNFMADYDLLKSSGLLDKLMIGEIVNEKEIPPLIPASEISEIRTLIDMHKSDIMQNVYEPHAYISRQVERFGTLANITIEPLMKLIEQKIQGIPQEDITKVVELVRTGNFKNKKAVLYFTYNTA